MKNGKQLSYVAIQKNLFKKLASVKIIYDNNLTQEVEIVKEDFPKKHYNKVVESLYEKLNKRYPDCIKKHKTGNLVLLINRPVFDRMQSNIQSMSNN